MTEPLHDDIGRLKSLFAALNATNEAILRSRTPDELFRRICAAAVQAGDFKTAAVLVPRDGAGSGDVVVVATTDASAPLATTRIALDPAIPEGRGLVSTAYRTRSPCIAQDFLADPRTEAWHDLARRRGIRSAAAIPVVRSDTVCAILTLYSGVLHAFDQELLTWLSRIAENVAFALDRYETAASLAASERRAHDLLELVADGVWETDPDLRLLRVEGRVGHAPDWHGRGGVDDHVLHHPILGGDPALREALSRRESVRGFESVLLDADGSMRAYAIDARPRHAGDGRFSGYVGTVRDVTERRRSEHLRDLEHDVTRRLAETTGPRKVLQAVLQVICESEKWESGGYFRYEDEAGTARLVTGWRGPGASDTVAEYYADKIGFVIPSGGLLSRVKESGKPLMVADVTTVGSVWVDRVAATGHRSNLIFPVRVGDRVIGAFGFGGTVMRAPDDALVQTVRVIADQVGQFIQRKENEEAVRDSEARFRALTQLSSDWYWEADEAFRFTRIEGRSAPAGGRPSWEGLLGKAPWEADYEIVETGGWEACRASLAAREPLRRVVLRRKGGDGLYRYASVSAEPMVDRSGRVTGYRGVSADITTRLQIEEELRRHRDHLQELVDEQTATLRRAMEAAEAANRAKSAFLSNMSHELRTPMHAILSFANLGRSKADGGDLTTDRATHFFDRIDQSAQRLLHLLTDLLDYARLDAARMKYTMQTIDVASLVAKVTGEFDVLAASRRIRLSVEAPGSAQAACDAMRVAQVVRNVVSNALKWTPSEGRVAVVVTRGETSAAVPPAFGDVVRVAVSDTGPGVPPGELQAIFEEFVQSSRTRTGAGGTGLGLAISRRIVSDHGGRIWAENLPEGGAVFTFEIPVDGPPDVPGEPDASRAGEASALPVPVSEGAASTGLDRGHEFL